MTQPIQPLHDRVIVEPLPVESKTASGIIIPDSAKEKPQKGKVAYIGSYSKIHEIVSEIIKDLEGIYPDELLVKIKKYKVDLIKMEVKQGDTVLYAKFAGQDIEIDGKKHLLMREPDILAIYE